MNHTPFADSNPSHVTKLFALDATHLNVHSIQTVVFVQNFIQFHSPILQGEISRTSGSLTIVPRVLVLISSYVFISFELLGNRSFNAYVYICFFDRIL